MKVERGKSGGAAVRTFRPARRIGWVFVAILTSETIAIFVGLVWFPATVEIGKLVPYGLAFGTLLFLTLLFAIAPFAGISVDDRWLVVGSPWSVRKHRIELSKLRDFYEYEIEAPIRTQGVVLAYTGGSRMGETHNGLVPIFLELGLEDYQIVQELKELLLTAATRLHFSGSLRFRTNREFFGFLNKVRLSGTT